MSLVSWSNAIFKVAGNCRELKLTNVVRRQVRSTFYSETLNLCRPLFLLASITLRPFLVFIRARKPDVLFCFRLVPPKVR